MNLAIPKKSLEVTLAQLSHAGVKTQNEDSIGIRQPNGYLQSTKGIAAVIADGVSASEGGKEASEICVQGFLNDYFSTPDSWSVKKVWRRSL
jgi:serine/threonine protein phosphatase PrpC